MPEVLHSVAQQRAREGSTVEPKPGTLIAKYSVNRFTDPPPPKRRVSGRRDATWWSWLATMWKMNVLRRDRL